MSGSRRRGKSVSPGLPFSLLLIVSLLLIWSVEVVQGQQASTSASLNDPATATGTTSKGTTSTNDTTSLPSSTSVIPVPLSTQKVPFVVKTPRYTDKSQVLRDAYFTGCSDSSSVGYVAAISRINVSTLYSQLDRYTGDSAMGNGYPFSAGVLRVVGIGNVGNQSYAFNSYTDSAGATTGLLSAIQVSTKFSTLPVFSNYTYLCDRIYPTQNDSVHPDVNPPSCQYGPGTVSFGIDVPLNSSYEAGTLVTEIRLTDSSSPALTIACIELHSSPYIADRWYWKFMMWLPIALIIGFFFLTLSSTLLAAEAAQRSAFKNRAREGGAPKLFHDKLSPLIVSALSGRGLVTSPALLRFVTPGCWDILLHLQFIVAIAMCHVQWPDFAYPFLRQAAWASLLGNVTLTQPEDDSISPLSTDALLPSGDLGNQMNSAISPLYMNASQSNVLLNLQENGDGIETYASMVGLHAENLFGTCLGIWLAIVAAIVVLSLLVWIIDWAVQSHDRVQQRRDEAELPSSPGLDLTDLTEGKAWDKDNLGRKPAASSSSLYHLSMSAGGWRSAIGLHGKALHGNLVRVLVLFHLPITVVSCYQFTLAKQHSIVSVALAALAFAVVSLLLPIYLIVRIAKTPLQKLFEHVGTLLALGPVYHHYSPGSQLFYTVSFAHSLIIGVVVGAGQTSGAAQAIVIVVVEVFFTLASSLWLPWGEGAMMGPLSFMANVVRIITAILVLLLTDLIGLSFSARNWVTYVILLLQGIYLAGAILVILVKITEAGIRLIWRVGFDERFSARTAGLGGAIRKIKRRKLKGQRRASDSSSVKLQQIKRENRMSNLSDGSTNTMSHMLKHSQNIPMSHSRSASYADYLGTGKGRPTSSHISSFHRLDEESGHIMAALPPVSPGTGSSFQGPSQGFVRMGGGKATDVNPYAALPTQEVTPRGPTPQRPRIQSQSGIVESWGGGDAAARKVVDSKNSYFALAQTPSHELSSTQVAALAASKSLQLQRQQQQQQEQEAMQRQQQQQVSTKDGDKKQGKMFTWGKPKSRQDAVDEDEWSDEGTTWDSTAAARNKGAWAGVAKMSAALTNLKKNIIGGRETSTNSENEEDDAEAANGGSLPPSGSGAFEVVRPMKPRVTPSKSVAEIEVVTQSNDQTNQAESRPIGYTANHLGILAADMQRVPSSAGHTVEQTGEERFWLPPLDLSTIREGL